MTEVRKQLDGPEEKPSVSACSNLPTGLPMPVVRLLVATVLGKDVQPGNEILYSLKTGVCATGSRHNEALGHIFHGQIAARRLQQSMAGKLTGTARDRDTISSATMTEIDAKIGQITAKLRSLLRIKS